MDDLREFELLALRFIGEQLAHCVGMIDSDEKFAAALTFLSLQQRGYLVSSLTPAGPVYQLSDKGSESITQWGHA